MVDKRFLVLAIISLPLISIVTGTIMSQDEKVDVQGEMVPDIMMEVMKENKSISYDARISNDLFEVFNNGVWETLRIKGVNMGMAKPGYFPGESAITYSEYFRWITQIGDMNANTIRTYSIHPPQFYKALEDHNKNSEAKVYLLQGVWIDEEMMRSAKTAFAPQLSEEFNYRISNAINVIHGRANGYSTSELPMGIFSYDVSRYTIGIIIGIEWDPYLVLRTDETCKDIVDIEEEFIFTENGSAFEIWIAGILNSAIEYESREFYHQTPMSFINYQALDKMDHPEEPWKEEDMASIDPDNIKGTDSYAPDLFATFHVYPYYPDFMNFNKTYQTTIDAEGECNNYAGYLKDLHECHETPILIGEFGVPSSDGISHSSIQGMNQGHLTEEEQGLMDAKMFLTIIEEDLMGGVLFSWQDEWFKTSWNTVGNIDRDRNPLWYNSLNCEENYGLLSFEPGEGRSIVIDGQNKDWLNCDVKTEVRSKMNGVINNFEITSDEGYLYFAISMEEQNNTEIMVLINTIEGQGTQQIPGGFVSEIGTDFLIEIDSEAGSRVLVNGEYDTFAQKYDQRSMNNEFNPIRMFLRSELEDKISGEIIPQDIFEVGILEQGTTDPENDQFNSNADINIDEVSGLIEIRIPWNLLNFKDPSTKKIIGSEFSDGTFSSDLIDGIDMCVIARNKIDGSIVGGSISDSNGSDLEIINGSDYISYEWDSWDKPCFHERLKLSYFIMKEIFSNL